VTVDRSERLVSLDAFRGITIMGMILVNNPGSWSHVYAPLRHAEWHGWTPTDFVFPAFLFIMGVAMAFSLPKVRERAEPRQVRIRILRRAATILALGIFLNAFPSFDFADLRWGGVLQRIALVYVAAAVILHASRRTQAWTIVGLLVGYWAAMMLIPVPGYGAGDLEAGHSLASWIDRHLMPGRLWQETWDPEGLLSTLPAIATTLLGAFTGYWVRSGRERTEIAAGMFAAGWGLILAGLTWSLVFPINKPLWTSSYVLFTAGASLQALACCYWLIDVRGRRRWAAPAIVFGMNPLAVFFLSSLTAKILYTVKLPGGGSLKGWLWETFFASWPNLQFASLVFAVLYITFWWGAMALLHNRGIFIKA
jgi:predicted acyltransferase